MHDNEILKFYIEQLAAECSAGNFEVQLTAAKWCVLLLLSLQFQADRDESWMKWQCNRVITCFYQVINRMWENYTCLPLQWEKIVDQEDGAELFVGEYKLLICTGVAAKTVESYGLKETTTGQKKTATLKKIFSGNGDAKTARTKPSFQLFMDSVESVINKAAAILAKNCDVLRMTKVVKSNRDDFATMLKKSYLKISDLKFILDNSDNFIDFSQFIDESGNVNVDGSSNGISFVTDTKTGLITPILPGGLNFQLEHQNVIFYALFGKTMDTIMDDIAAKHNKKIESQKK